MKSCEGVGASGGFLCLSECLDPSLPILSAPGFKNECLATDSRHGGQGGASGFTARGKNWTDPPAPPRAAQEAQNRVFAPCPPGGATQRVTSSRASLA